MFFLGTATPSGTVKTVRAINGAQPYEVFKIVIDRMLAKSAADSASRTRESASPSP
jgi:predicted DsbA family dithiol-disulfide isomerase